MFYLVGGLLLRSHRSLPGMPEVPGGAWDLDIEWARDRFISAKDGPLVPHPNGLMAYRVVRPRILVSYADDLEVEHDLDSSSLRIWSSRGPSLHLSHQVADSVIPLVLSMKGRLVFHGAVLATGASCVAVIGKSMAGKSTLTAHWVVRGGQFLSDDWFAVEAGEGEVVVEPSHPSIRLRSSNRDLVDLANVASHEWLDGYSKRWYQLSPGRGFSSSRLPLSCLVAYHRSSNVARPTSRALSSQDAVTLLLPHLLVLDLSSRETWALVLEDLRLLVNQVRVEELVVRDGRPGLDACADWLGASRSQPG